MSALAPGFDPLIAEAKLRMRRRRVLIAVLVLLAGAGVLFLILRPSPAPGPIHLTLHGGKGDALSHINVPVDASERTWRAGIKSVTHHPLTPIGVTELERSVVGVIGKTGAEVLRMDVWPRAGAAEVVLATKTNPAEYLVHHAPLLVHLLDHGYPYVKVVNGNGSRIFEWYYLPASGMVGYAKGLDECGPVYHSEPQLQGGPPPCPAK
jgi:hypothetical protein